MSAYTNSLLGGHAAPVPMVSALRELIVLNTEESLKHKITFLTDTNIPAVPCFVS